jgi:hypothetical protein
MSQEGPEKPGTGNQRGLSPPLKAHVCQSLSRGRQQRNPGERSAHSILGQSHTSGRPETRPCFFLHIPRLPYTRLPCHLLWLTNAHSQGLCLQRKCDFQPQPSIPCRGRETHSICSIHRRFLLAVPQLQESQLGSRRACSRKVAPVFHECQGRATFGFAKPG